MLTFDILLNFTLINNCQLLHPNFYPNLLSSNSIYILLHKQEQICVFPWKHQKQQHHNITYNFFIKYNSTRLFDRFR